ncbi:hypothetical protein OG271_16980 [Micromonospora rifamycinica]|uniref:hypothetical protein n=1 Tax=Micromonospora rifamycinica TaxID=291594 RepID=UPI002E28E4C7|nr:hypothetical protein [Micromonospora rifamycinica]
MARSWFGTGTGPDLGLDPARVAETIVADMQGVSMGGYPVAVEPVVVPVGSYRGLLDATTRLLDLQRRAVVHLASDEAGRMAALGVDPRAHPRVIDDESFELRHCAEMARADVLIAEDGPRFVEFNVGASFGGMVQFDLHRRAWQRLAAGAGGPALSSPDPFALYATLIRRICAELGIDPSVLLVGSLQDPSVSERFFDIQLGRLRDHGVRARFARLDRLLDVMGPPATLARTLGLVHVCENEAQASGWDMSALVTALRSGLRMFPSQTTRLVDSKKVLALLSEGLPWMSADEHALVQRVVPWSRVMGDRWVEWRGRRYELPRLVVERQELFVLKGAAGFSSEEVHFGTRTAADRWAKLVESAATSEYYVAQEIVPVVRHPVRVMLDESGETETVSANSVLSPFTIGGAATGCLVRFDRATEPGAITVRSGARLACLFPQPT